MYIATTYWSGALNIGHMRTFKTEKAAWDYIETLHWVDPNATPERQARDKTAHYKYFSRVYKLYPDKEPELLRKQASK